jgi:hypothetical protein
MRECLTIRDLEMMRERDLAIEICLSNALQPSDAFDTRQKIRAAIEKADTAWKNDILPARANKEQTMRLVDIIKERDLAIELCILNVLNPANRDQARNTIRAAINKAGEAWEKDILPARVGDEMAARVRDRLYTSLAPR